MTIYRELINSAGLLADGLSRAPFMDETILRALRTTLLAAQRSPDAPPPAVAELTKATAALDTAWGNGNTPSSVAAQIERHVTAAGRYKFFSESKAQTTDAPGVERLLNSCFILLVALEKAEAISPPIVAALRATLSEAAAASPENVRRSLVRAIELIDAAESGAGTTPGALVWTLSAYLGQARRDLARSMPSPQWAAAIQP